MASLKNSLKNFGKKIDKISDEKNAGSVSLPSGEDKQDAMNEEFMTILCGALGGLVYGITNGNDKKLRAQLTKPSLISKMYQDVKAINTTGVNRTLQDIKKLLTKSLDPKLLTKSSTDNVNAVKTIVKKLDTGDKNLTKFFGDKFEETSKLLDFEKKGLNIKIKDKKSFTDLLKEGTGVNELKNKGKTEKGPSSKQSDVAISVKNASDVTELFKSIKDIKGGNVEQLKTMVSALNDMSGLKLDNLDKLDGNTKNIDKIVKNVNEVDEEDISNATETLKGISLLVISAGSVLILGSLAMKIVKPKDLVTFGAVLLLFVTSIIGVAAIASNFAKDSLEHIGEIGKAVILCGAALIVGGFVSRYIKLQDYIKFAAALTLLILGVTLPFKNFGKEQAALFQHIQNFGVFVAIAAGVLLIGSAIVKYIPIKNILTFTALLSLFIFAVTLPFLLFKQLSAEAFEGMKSFSVAVVICATVLLLGSFIAKYIPITDILTFTALLSLFIFATALPFLLFKQLSAEAFEGMKSFAIAITICAAVLFLGSFLVKYIPIADILKFTGLLSLFIFATALPFLLFSAIKTNVLDAAKAFTLVIVVASTVMLLGSYFMESIPIGSILLFTLMLSIFILGVTLPLLLFNLFSKETAIAAVILMGVVALAATIMLVGALIMQDISIVHILLFTAMLALFILGTTVPLLLFLLFSPQAIAGVLAFGIVIAISATVMLLGAYLMKEYISKSDIEDFTSCLAWFIGETIAAYGIASKTITREMKSAVDFAILIAISAATMLIGGFVLGRWVEREDVEEFTDLLAWFIGETILAYGLACKTISKELEDAKKFGLLVVISAGTMLIGGYFIQYVKKEDIEQFTNLLAWFIGETIAAMGIGLRFVPSLNPSLLVIDKIGIMVALMGGILLIAGLIINRNPGIMGDIAAFSDVLELFLLGMSGIIFLIAKFIPYRSAMKALLILGALSLITAAFTVVMAGMGYVIKEYELDNILTGLGVVALIIAGIALIAAGLQLAAPYITIGLAVLGGIVLIALGISQALYNIAEALKIMEEVEDFDASNCVAALESVLGLVPVLSKFDDDFVDAVEIASDCIKPMAKMISEMAHCVEQYANLKVAIYDGDKISGYRKLKQKDFASAGENVKLIMLTMMTAIEECYVGREDLFDGKEDAPVMKVINTGLKMSKLISEMAKAVGDYAKLVIPIEWDENGKAINYRSLKNKDFKDAANNIGYIMTYMIEALEQCYFGGENQRLFDGDADDTPAMKVINVMNMLGQNIGGIADTVVKFATSMIPDQWDENGKAKHYKKLSKSDYKDAIATIKTIMTTTIDGISECYDGKYKDIFKNGGLLGMGDTPAEKVLATLESVGKSIGGIADIVLQFATSQIPIVWDKEGNPIEYRQLTIADYAGAVATISTIMTTLIDGISKAYNDNKSVFEGEGDNPVKKAIESLSGLGEFIGGIADSVIKLASNQVACKWNPETGAPIEYAQLDSAAYTGAATTISTILTTMVEGIKKASAGTDLKEIEKAMEAFGEIGTLISGIANGVIGIASLRVPDQWNDQGQPIHFTEVPETAITDAGNNIKEVMLTMVDGVKEAYNKIKDEMSPKDLEEIIGVMTDIVNPISAATKIVSDLAVLRIPIRYNENGQPIDYRQFNVIDMVNCKINVLKIVDALLESVTKAGDAAKTFEASGNLDDVLKTMTSITNVLSKCGDILKTFGTGEIPITNNEGNIIKTLYIDFESAKTRITELLTSLLGSVSSVAAIAKTTTADLDPVTTAMNSVVGLLEKIAKPLAYYGSGLFPKEIDKDGNIKSWVTIDFAKAGENIKTLLTAIIGVISEVKEKHGKLFTNENADAISDMLTNMLDTYNEFTPLITTIAEGSAKLTEIVANVKLTDTEKCLNLIKYFSDSVSLIKELNLISSISNIPGLSNNNKFNVQEIQDVVNNVQEVTKIVADASTKISPIVNQSQEIDIIKFGKIVNSLNGTLQLLKTFGIEGDGLEEVKVERDGILGFLGFKKKEMQPKYIKIDPKQVEIIDSLASVVEKLVKSTNLIQDFISTSRPIDIEKFRETLKYSSVVLQEVSDFIDAQGTFISNKFNGMEYSSFNEILAAQLETVSGIVRITKESSNIDSNGLNSLQIATKVINEICSLAEAPKNFSEQEKTLNKYVKSINSLNTAKVDSLTKLLWSMNHLAYKMGNLDKFTKVLAEQMSSVLTKLTMELKNAKETIKAAQKLQEAREKSINKSIENVKSLMSQSMTVEITQTSTGYGDEGEGTPGSISGDSSTGSPASGGAGGAGGSGTGGSDYAAPTANLSPTYSQVQQKLEMKTKCKVTGKNGQTYTVHWFD